MNSLQPWSWCMGDASIARVIWVIAR